jgi:hypothetical protein
MAARLLERGDLVEPARFCLDWRDTPASVDRVAECLQWISNWIRAVKTLVPSGRLYVYVKIEEVPADGSDQDH